MVQTVQQTLLHSQLACNEMQASARTCGRHAADSMIENVGSSQYTLIIPWSWRVIQLTTISSWVTKTRLHLPQVNKLKKIPLKKVKNLATPSPVFIFISSSSTGEVFSHPIRGNVHRIGQMFREHVEQSFLDPEYSFIAVQ